MKFIDLRTEKPTELELPLDKIQHLLKEETGRELITNDEIYKKNEDSLKLVRWADPIGFGVVAAKKIPKGTPLFCYGGILQDEVDMENFYLQSLNETNSLYLNAKKTGDLGTLLAHAPTQATLDCLGFSKLDQQEIQTVNTTAKITNNNLLFIANEDILPGTVITHNYGENYWRETKKSFSLFKKNSVELVDLTDMKFNGQGHITRTPNDGTYFTNGSNYFSAYTQPLLFICKILLTANAFTKKSDGHMKILWLMISNQAAKSDIQVSLEKSPIKDNEVELIIRDNKMKLEMALDINQQMNKVREIITPTSGSDKTPCAITLKDAHGFFEARQIERYTHQPKVYDCPPPTGSQIYNGMTVLPNPF